LVFGVVRGCSFYGFFSIFFLLAIIKGEKMLVWLLIQDESILLIVLGLFLFVVEGLHS